MLLVYSKLVSATIRPRRNTQLLVDASVIVKLQEETRLVSVLARQNG